MKVEIKEINIKIVEKTKEIIKVLITAFPFFILLFSGFYIVCDTELNKVWWGFPYIISASILVVAALMCAMINIEKIVCKNNSPYKDNIKNLKVLIKEYYDPRRGNGVCKHNRQINDSGGLIIENCKLIDKIIKILDMDLSVMRKDIF